MKKYIDAEGVMRACYDSFLKTGNKAYREIFALVEAVPAADVQEAFKAIHDAPVIILPAADVVEVVRCKECKWFGDIGCAIRIVDDSDRPSENDFCSFAERKDNG